MKLPRQLLAAALAAATLVITAAPSAPPSIDLGTYTWQTMLGTTTLPLSNGTIQVIKVVGDDIYLGGDFTDFAGIAQADRIVRWSGANQEWQGIATTGATDGSITAGTVKAIEVSGNILYVGGDFTVTTANNESHHNLAWVTLPDPTFSGDWQGFPGDSVHSDAVWNGEVRTITAHLGDLYVGGTFTDGFDDSHNDYIMIGSFNLCNTNVVTGCANSVPDVTVCGGVTITCDAFPPNFWYSAGGLGVGAFVSSIIEDPDGGVLVTGDFSTAGGNVNANALARFEYGQTPDWIGQGTMAGTMFPTAALDGQLYAAGWEAAYRRTAPNTWAQICASVLLGGAHWKSIVPLSSSLVLLASIGGIWACNPETGNSEQISTNEHVVVMAMYKGDLIVAGDIIVGGLTGTSDYIARLAAPVDDLPPTNRDSQRSTETALLLITLTALTALAGTQLLRRA